jgi:diadenosine tetraphosphatase ApaH/serine/threonine PP2A family protein phosphatase
MPRLDRLLKLIASCAVFVALTGTAEAGPPLICHPFDAGSAAMLPWGPGPGWNSPDRSYDVQHLTADTLRLLAPATPVLARMEIMRRATIYASRDQKAASTLLKAILDRARATPEGTRDPMPWFDAGYLIESYRQMKSAGPAGGGMLAGAEHLWAGFRDDPRAVEGYSLVRRALQLVGSSPEMEFAASLMQQGDVAAAHRQRATAGAPAGSLLAKNLATVGK